MNKFFITCVCMLAALGAFAQSYLDIANCTHHESATGIHDSAGNDQHLYEVGLSVKAPLKQENGEVVLLGFSGSIGMLPLENGTMLNIGSACMQLGLIRKHSEHSSMQAVLLPRFNSGLKKFSKGAFQLGGIVLFTRKKTGKLKLKYGMYYNRECFGNFLVPMLGLDWRPSSKLQVYGVLPMNATAAYKVCPVISAGVNFTGIISSYALDNSRYLHKASNELWLFADGYLTDHLVVQVRAGRSLGRSYRTYASGDKIGLGISALKFGDDRVKAIDDIDDAFLMQASFIYRVAVE